ncbi:DUF1310 domain-containing protein [Streptococcus suis]|nr:DUF1310 family protein [Streptococcus suis]MCO8175544.1 DUF1310 domain-containing protein [Streptococcus suis]MCO8210017.1 DUF1310 domain-containing protein [Streptococcus suis]
MKTVVKILVGVIVAIALGIGGFKLMQKIEHDQMVEIVKSEEVREIIEERLISYDTRALTEEGAIRSYSIDSSSIRRNPMGGISFTVYVNNDSGLYVFYTINKDSNTKK